MGWSELRVATSTRASRSGLSLLPSTRGLQTAHSSPTQSGPTKAVVECTQATDL